LTVEAPRRGRRGRSSESREGDDGLRPGRTHFHWTIGGVVALRELGNDDAARLSMSALDEGDRAASLPRPIRDFRKNHVPMMGSRLY
jgi:hypothetical protein